VRSGAGDESNDAGRDALVVPAAAYNYLKAPFPAVLALLHSPLRAHLSLTRIRLKQRSYTMDASIRAVRLYMLGTLSLVLLLGLISLPLALPSGPRPLQAAPQAAAGFIQPAQLMQRHQIYLPLVSTLPPPAAHVTPEGGGQSTLSDGSVTVSIPAGAVNEPALLTLSSAAVGGPAYHSDLGLTLEVQLRSLSGAPVSALNLPARLSFRLAASPVGSETSRLVIAHRQADGTWTILPTFIDQTQGVAWAESDHFSAFGLFRAPLDDEGFFALGMVADAAGNTYWLDWPTLTIMQGSLGLTNSRPYLDLNPLIHTWTGDGDLALDPAGGTLFFADGLRVWRIPPDLQAQAIFSTHNPTPDSNDTLQGLFFDQRDGTLYVARRYSVVQLDAQTGSLLRTLSTSGLPEIFSYELLDVAVNSQGGVFVSLRAPSRSTTISNRAWGELYYMSPGSSAWQLMSQGLLWPNGLALDANDTLYVANRAGDAISVIAGTEPTVVGAIRGVRGPTALSVVGGTLLVSGRSLTTLPLSRRDPLPTALAASFDFEQLSGQGSLIKVMLQDGDPIPAHTVLRVGDQVIREIATVEAGQISFQLPWTPHHLHTPWIGRRLTVADGLLSLSSVGQSVVGPPITTPLPGHWHAGHLRPDRPVLELAQGEWIFWSSSFEPGIIAVESQDGLFPPWASAGGGNWLAYQFTQVGRFTLTLTTRDGQRHTQVVDVTRMGPGNRFPMEFHIDPEQGGIFYSNGARLEVPAGALPGSSIYTTTLAITQQANPSRDARVSTGYRYRLHLDPEPQRLEQPIKLHMPFDAEVLNEEPRAALFDDILGDFILLDATIDPTGTTLITFEAGPYASSSTASVPVHTARSPLIASAAPPQGQSLRGAFNTVAKSLWWVTGMPNEKVENERFVILYHTGDGVSESYALRLLDALSKSVSILNGSYGYPLPSSQVIIKIAPWATAITQADGFVPNIGTLGNWYMFFNDKLDDDELKATAAHELFHVLQKEVMSTGGRVGAPTWWLEGTAVWAEYAVFPEVTSYMQRLDQGGEFITRGMDAWNSTPESQYATVGFAIFLEDQYGQGTIKRVFEQLGLTTGVETALEYAAGTSMDAIFEQFARTYLLQQRAPYDSWNILAAVSDYKLSTPENMLLNTSMPRLSARLIRAYVYPPGLASPPPSFSAASGSVMRMPSSCANSRVRLFNGSKQALGRMFMGEVPPEQGEALARLDSYTPTQPLYALVSVLNDTSCNLALLWETPTISKIEPTQGVINQALQVTIYTSGFGPREGMTIWAGGEPMSPTFVARDYLEFTLPASKFAGQISIQVQHASGPSSNAVSITIVDPEAPAE
jgi:DNA-binding beta-propeller fold protein YncE